MTSWFTCFITEEDKVDVKFFSENKHNGAVHFPKKFLQTTCRSVGYNKRLGKNDIVFFSKNIKTSNNDVTMNVTLTKTLHGKESTCSTILTAVQMELSYAMRQTQKSGTIIWYQKAKTNN